jgi:coenzyme PQQ precursor peptide PqqA
VLDAHNQPGPVVSNHLLARVMRRSISAPCFSTGYERWPGAGPWPGRCIVEHTGRHPPLVPRTGHNRCNDNRSSLHGEYAMKWETPDYNDIRFGFEVTMYINNR